MKDSVEREALGDAEEEGDAVGGLAAAVHDLDLVDQVALELFDAEDGQDVVGVDGTVDEGVAGAHALSSCTLTCTERGTLYSWRVPSSARR